MKEISDSHYINFSLLLQLTKPPFEVYFNDFRIIENLLSEQMK